MENVEKVSVVACHWVDFTSKDTGEPIKGYKVYYTRPCYDSEVNRGWSTDVKLDSIFVRPEQHITIPSFVRLPCPCDFVYTPSGKYNRLSAIRLSSDK